MSRGRGRGGVAGGGGGGRRADKEDDEDSKERQLLPNARSSKIPDPLWPEFTDLPDPPVISAQHRFMLQKALQQRNFWRNSVFYYMPQQRKKQKREMNLENLVRYSDQFAVSSGAFDGSNSFSLEKLFEPSKSLFPSDLTQRKKDHQKKKNLKLDFSLLEQREAVGAPKEKKEDKNKEKKDDEEEEEPQEEEEEEENDYSTVSGFDDDELEEEDGGDEEAAY